MRSKAITSFHGTTKKNKNKIGKTTHNRILDRYSLSHRMFCCYIQRRYIHPSWLKKPATPTYCVPSFCAKYSRSLNLHFILDVFVCFVFVVFFTNRSLATVELLGCYCCGWGVWGSGICVLCRWSFFLPFLRLFRQTIRWEDGLQHVFFLCRQNDNIIPCHRLPTICIHHFARNV